jgi:hypothetical protein
MLDRIRGLAARWKGWPIILAILISGLVFVIIGELLQQAAAETSVAHALGSMLSKIGTVVVGGGVGGAVMKVMATEGFFLDAVAQVIYGREGMSRLSDDQLRGTWRDLTEHIYMPNLVGPVTHENDDDLRRLRRDLQNAVAEKFNYRADFFIAKMDRVIEFKWADPACSRIWLSDENRTKLVPFNPQNSTTWQHSMQADAGTELKEYEIDELGCKFVDGRDVDKRFDINPDRRLTIYTLPPASQHEIIRNRALKWPLEKDPTFSFISPYVVNHADVTLVNQAQGLRVVISSMGKRTCSSRWRVAG